MKRARALVLISCAILAAIPVLVRADEGPVVIANKEQHPTLSLDPFHGAIGVTGLYLSDRNSTGGASIESTDLILTQDLTLSTGGAIVSRNLAYWTASATLSLEEEWVTGTQTNQSNMGVFDTYDLELNAFNATAFPFLVFATRTQNYVNQAFAATVRDTDTTYGATFHYNNDFLPSTLSISHTDTDQSSLSGQSELNVAQNNVDFSTSFAPSERQMASFNYHYATIAQSSPTFASNNSELQGISATHNWSIDPAGRYTLTQSLDYSQQSGSFPFTQLRLDEQLRLRHSDSLESGFNYTYEMHDYPSNSVTRNTIIAHLTHRLYESLITTGRVGGSFSQNSFSSGGQSGDSTTTNYFADMVMNYSKKAFMGRLGANLSLGINVTDNGEIGSPQQVLDNVQTFNGLQPIILTQQGLDPTSIAVFNAAGTRRYTENVDYQVTQARHSVQVSIKPGGAINPGDTVRLNYLINPLPGYTSQTTTFGTGLNYYFDEGPLNGLNLFARYFQSNQTISPQTSGVLPDDVHDYTIGSEYRIWKLTLRAEDQTHDSTLAPYDALRFAAAYTDKLGDRTTLSLDAIQTYMRFPADASRSTFTTFDGRMEYEISRGLRAIIAARWNKDDESTVGTTTGFEQSAELHWKIRQTDVFGMVRHTTLDNNNNSEDTLFFQFGISRNF